MVFERSARLFQSYHFLLSFISRISVTSLKSQENYSSTNARMHLEYSRKLTALLEHRYFQVHAVSLSLRHVTSRSSQKGELEMVSKAMRAQKRIKKLARRAQIRLRKTCLMPQRTLVFSRIQHFFTLSQEYPTHCITITSSLKPRTLKITHSIPRRHTEPYTQVRTYRQGWRFEQL